LLDPSGLNYLSPRVAPRLIPLIRRKTFMAEEGNGSGGVGVVAIVVIFVLVILAGLFVFRNRIFRGGGTQKIDVNISAPSK
jgi:hypothetical protein